MGAQSSGSIGETTVQDKLQLKWKQKITISKPSSATTNNLMALFGNVEVVSLPYTLPDSARDGERWRYGGEEQPREISSRFFSFAFWVCARCQLLAIRQLLYSLAIYTVGAGIGMQIESGAYRSSTNGDIRSTTTRLSLWIGLVVGQNGNNNSDKRWITKPGFWCECVCTSTCVCLFRNNLFNTKFIRYSWRSGRSKGKAQNRTFVELTCKP